jgi:hypothetical protein
VKKDKRFKHSDFTPNIYIVMCWAMLPIALIILWGVISICESMTY